MLVVTEYGVKLSYELRGHFRRRCSMISSLSEDVVGLSETTVKDGTRLFLNSKQEKE